MPSVRNAERMRAVADTNVVISGLLWQGPSKRVLDLARAGRIELFTSPALLAELDEVLQRRKFLRRLNAIGAQARDLVLGYAALTRVVHPSSVPAVVEEDPDDDMVLACALTARAAAIISGDRHLLSLGEYQDIPILTAVRFLDL